MDLGLTDWARLALAEAELTPAAHHRLLMTELEALSAGEIDRLMVLMPPGSAKSTYVSILFPAWFLARHRRAALITSCHTESLASHFGRRTRALVQEHANHLGYRLTPEERAADRWRSVSGALRPLRGAWPSGWVFVGLDPGHQVVDARVLPAVDEAGEGLGEIALRVDGVQFAGFN